MQAAIKITKETSADTIIAESMDEIAAIVDQYLMTEGVQEIGISIELLEDRGLSATFKIEHLDGNLMKVSMPYFKANMAFDQDDSDVIRLAHLLIATFDGVSAAQIPEPQNGTVH